VSDTANGRTHEPNLRELTAQIDGLVKLYEERDRRYEERFISQDEKTTLALTASKEAISKAEMATEKRFESVNEFRGAMSDQASLQLPRAEAENRFSAYDNKLDEIKKDVSALREWRSEGGGQVLGRSSEREQSRWIIGLAVTLGAALVGLLGLGLKVFVESGR
jgi:hypothetical protein